jgi:hypothetical protein
MGVEVAKIDLLKPHEMRMEQFIRGAIAMASVVAATFFLRFWRETGDRLFAMFATAFFLLGVTRLGLALFDEGSESQTYWYWVRFIAFALILIAIADKNRQTRSITTLRAG